MKKRLRLAVLVVLAAGVLVLLSRLLDFPAFQDPYVYGIEGLLDPARTKFYSYSLGGYIDEESLWRIDGDRVAIEAAISGLGLQRTDSIPQEFWRFLPYYWPKKRFSGAVAYRSPFFEGSQRGQDGLHYFAVHDPASNRAYVWVKDNF
jgi:hypothetical protein